MNIAYDKETDAAYISFVEERMPGMVAYTYPCDPDKVNGQIQLDFDSLGRLVGIEVLVLAGEGR